MRQHGIDPDVNGDDAAVTTGGGGGNEVQHGMSALKLSESKPASSPGGRLDVFTQPLTGQFVSKGGKSLYLEKLAMLWDGKIEGIC